MRVDSRWKALAALCTLATVLVLLSVRRPVPGALPVCPFYVLTGLYCPGCGSLRAMHQLMRGHLLAAFGHNPMLFILLPVLCYLPISWARVLLVGRGLPEFTPPPVVTWSLVGTIIVFWVARNVPLYPFTWLAP